MQYSSPFCHSVVNNASNFHWHVLPVWTSQKSNLSTFDDDLLSLWKKAAKEGRFKYDLKIEGTKVLPKVWNFVVELNVQRGFNRRKAEEFNSVTEPFNPEKFNFTQMKPEEVLLQMQSPHQNQDFMERDLIAINVSPINEGHSLLLPMMNKTYPQRLNEHSIKSGLQALLMSKSAAFRVMFNSLLAYASVNHLHLHLLYICHSMFLEYCDLQPLKGPCWQLLNYPGKAFVFQATPESEDDITQLSRNVHKLTNLFHTRNEAHNVCMTRGRASPDDTAMSAVRVFVWVRTPNPGSKNSMKFNPAACELFGYILYKDRDLYERSNEAEIACILESITKEPFERNRPIVEKLFTQ